MLSQKSYGYAYSKVTQKTYSHPALNRAHHNLHGCRTMLKGLMDKKIKNIEEQTAILQTELSQMSEELYAQQKEIKTLRSEIKSLKSKLQSVPTDSGILTADEDVPPPHY